MEFYGNSSISGVYKRHFNLELIKVIYYFDLGEIYKGFSIGGVVNKLMNIFALLGIQGAHFKSFF